MTKRAGLVLALLLLVGVISARADSISIFNTGVDNNGVLLPDGFVDPHYTVAPPGLSPGPAYVVSQTAFPLCSGCPWVPDGPNSKWIDPFSPIPGTGIPVGNYTYTTTFDLTGLDPGTAVLTGQWMTDNNGVEILLNGNVFSITTPFTSFVGPFSPFTINSGFVSGVNTLQLVVNEDGAYTGFRAELSGTATPVPEPGSLALLATGVAFVGNRLRKRRTARSGVRFD